MTLSSETVFRSTLAKRLFDIIVSATVLLCLFPVMIIAAIGVKASSPGPILYLADRSGKSGTTFRMLKFRTMHVGSDRSSAITAPGDSRIFRFGVWLRRLKIDELPQFWNILIGDMSIVGPRPEDPKIVARDYTDWMIDTLIVPPGITSPGAIYGYIYGDELLDPADPEGSYTRNLLPPKLALERAYLERANLWTDLLYVFLTAWAIVANATGRSVSLPKRELDLARKWAPQGPYPNNSL